MIGMLDPSSFFSVPTPPKNSTTNTNTQSTTDKYTLATRRNNTLAPIDTSLFNNTFSNDSLIPSSSSTYKPANITRFTNIKPKEELQEYIVRFKQGTGTDDIREIEKTIETQGGSYKRRGSFSQDLDADLPVVSLRYLAEKNCVERLLKRHSNSN